MADALIDKIIEDEVTAFFVPGAAGQDYACPGAKTPSEVLAGQQRPTGPRVPVGAGIRIGVAYVGLVER